MADKPNNRAYTSNNSLKLPGFKARNLRSAWANVSAGAALSMLGTSTAKIIRVALGGVLATYASIAAATNQDTKARDSFKNAGMHRSTTPVIVTEAELVANALDIKNKGRRMPETTRLGMK